MSSFLGHLYGLFFKPVQALTQLSNRSYWWQSSFLVWLILTLNLLSQAGEWEIRRAATMPLLFMGWGIGAFIWFGMTLLIHFTADLFGGHGQVIDTMTVTGFAWAPYLLLPSAMALPNVMGSWGFSIRILVLLALGFWSLVLTVLGLRSVQRFGLDQAVGSVLIGFVMLFALLGLLLVLSGVGFSFMLGQMN